MEFTQLLTLEFKDWNSQSSPLHSASIKKENIAASLETDFVLQWWCYLH